MAWLSSNSLSPTDSLHADQLNSLANDIRNWGGDVNGGGHHLSNVIIDGYSPPGGGVALNSPAQVIPSGGQPTAVMWFDTTDGGGNSTPRWQIGKDGTSETGANVGANFAITRFSDTGNLLAGTPFAIRRSDGLVTIGAQQWTGPINGGGQTISNVVITGIMQDPTTTKGDLIVHGSATTRMPVGADGFILTADSTQALGVKWAAAPATGVPTTRQVIAGAGLSGGGALSADVTLAAKPLGASGATHQAGMVPDPGAAAGATRYLREDATWAIPSGGGGGLTDPTTTLGDLIVRGAAATTRLGVGADGQVLTADHTQTLGVKWAAAGGSQTPWTQNINAAGFALNSVSSITTVSAVVGSSAAHVAGAAALSVRGPLEVSNTTYTDTSGQIIGALWYSDSFNASTPVRAAINVQLRGTTAGAKGGDMVFSTAPETGAIAEALRLLSTGAFCVGNFTANATGAPGGNLMLVAPSGVNNNIVLFQPGASAGTFGFKSGDSNLYVTNNYSGGAVGQVSSSIALTSAGFVGIGTPTPSDLLHVVSASGVRCAISLLQTSTVSAALGMKASDANFYLTNTSLAALGDAAHSIAIDANGNVGIGTIAPAPYKVTVVGDVNITGTFRVNGVPLATGGGASFTTTTTPSRVIGTIYQNTTGKVMLVIVGVALGASTFASAFCDAAASPTTLLCKVNAGSGSAFPPGTLVFIVQPGFYYTITATAGVNQSSWAECY